MKTGVERKNPYFINIISYDKDGNYYERMSFYAKNKKRKLRIVFKKNGYYYRKNGPALIVYGASTENFKLYCKYFNENGHIGRDYGPCSFKIMNDNSYSEEKYIINGFSFEKEEYDKLINNMKLIHPKGCTFFCKCFIKDTVTIEKIIKPVYNFKAN